MMMNMQLLMPIAQSLMTLMMTPGNKMIPGTLDQTGMMTGQLRAKTGAKLTMITGMKLITVLTIGHKMTGLDQNGLIPGLGRAGLISGMTTLTVDMGDMEDMVGMETIVIIRVMEIMVKIIKDMIMEATIKGMTTERKKKLKKKN